MALTLEDSIKVVKIFKELLKTSTQNDSATRTEQFDSLWASALHNDSLRVADLFNNLWESAVHKDSVINSQSLTFYSNSFSNLIATHVGLFSALIAVAIAVFVVKYWIDNKKFDEEYDDKLKKKTREIEKKIKSFREIDYTVAQTVYGSMIRSIMKIDGKEECTKDLIELVNAYIALGEEKKENGSAVVGISVVLTDLFNRILKTEQDDELPSCAVALLVTLDNLLENNEDLYMHINEDLYNQVLEKFGTEELKDKEKERKQKRDGNQPKNFWEKIKCACKEIKNIFVNSDENQEN
jgi:hypothetical protein